MMEEWSFDKIIHSLIRQEQYHKTEARMCIKIIIIQRKGVYYLFPLVINTQRNLKN